MDSLSRMLLQRELSRSDDFPRGVCVVGECGGRVDVEVDIESGPFGGARCSLSITIPMTYPIEGPRVILNSPPNVRSNHPSIDPATGAVCMSILRLGWQPVYNISLVLCGLSYILNDPIGSCRPSTTAELAEEPIVPLNPDALTKERLYIIGERHA